MFAAISRTPNVPVRRVITFLVIIALQMVLIDAVASGRYTMLGGKLPLAQALFAFHGIGKATLLAAMVTVGAALAFHRNFFTRQSHDFWRILALQCAIWSALMLVILSLPDGRRGVDLGAGLVLLYLASSLLLIFFSVTTVHALLNIDALVKGDRRVLGVGVITFLAFSGQHIFEIWFEAGPNTLLEDATLNLSLWFHGFLSLSTPLLSFKDTGVPVLYHADFAIALYPSCAGYQGMLTSFLLLLAFLLIEIKRLRILRASVLIVMATGAVFVINALRIALLFEIGVKISPEIALEGFHSNFGTLSVFLVVAATMMVLTLPVFRRLPDGPVTPAAGMWHASSDADLADKVLWQMVPLAAVLTTILVTGVFIGSFNWLYPIPIAVGSIAIAMQWGRIKTTFDQHLSWLAIAAGVAVYVFWITLVPRDDERESMLRATLQHAPTWAAVGWIFVRVIGSSVVVPIVEEIAFRGGVMSLLQHWLGRYMRAPLVTMTALTLTSIGFGLMHGAVLAGIIAGMFYGVVALHRHKLGDAIIAHAVTNLLISLHVFVLDDWSLW